MWKFSYPDGPSSIDNAHRPPGPPVRLLLTSRDVIHSFFVPRLPHQAGRAAGALHRAWFEARQTGRFQVLCAEFCGSGHSLMRAEWWSCPPAQFDAWLADQRRGLAARQDAGGAAARPGDARGARAGSPPSGTSASSATPWTARSTIGPTWLDLYRKTERARGRQGDSSPTRATSPSRR
jgi:cytochrome c oxidase subunit 2